MQPVHLHPNRPTLGDRRLDERHARIASQAAAHPSASFPQMTETDAECKALYRFLENERIDPARLLEPHIDATRRRMSDRDFGPMA